METLPPRFLVDLQLALFILAAFIVGMLLAIWAVALRQRMRGRRNRNRGRTAERRARKILKKAGYTNVASSPVFTTALLVDGEEETFDVTPDQLVEKDGLQYVVEVKRYRENSGVANATVRRQVLEYMIASGLPCLLVQMPEGEISVIDLPDDGDPTGVT
ncbi:MAG: hypothetical protein QNK37_20995 [Acidobacteriota bacterium]|nr:hypothetical protein [Acidobacteriota bacterium]